VEKSRFKVRNLRAMGQDLRFKIQNYKQKLKVMHFMNAVRGRYNTLPLINTAAILFTTKVVANLLFVIRETTG
jgi:hypothetical protein